MGKKDIKEIIVKISLKMIGFTFCIFICYGLLIIVELHKIVPFFPILFLFHFLFWVGHPLFVKYVLKIKWLDCTKDDFLSLKYILIPCIILEILVLLYYPHETWLAIQQIAQN